MAVSEERNAIIKQVLQRMDEICPEADINVVEGELIDSLLDNALVEYLLIANINKIPNIKTQEYEPPVEEPSVEGIAAGDSQTQEKEYTVNNNIIDAPDDYVRLVSVGCPEWRRELYESDCVSSTSLAWKMSTFPFHEPTPLKPMLAVLPHPQDGNVRFHLAPCRKGVCSLTYVYNTTPEGLMEKLGATDGFFQAYVWYVAHVTLTTMGQLDTAPLALQHAQAYQTIPNGVTNAPSK